MSIGLKNQRFYLCPRIRLLERLIECNHNTGVISRHKINAQQM